VQRSPLIDEGLYYSFLPSCYTPLTGSVHATFKQADPNISFNATDTALIAEGGEFGQCTVTKLNHGTVYWWADTLSRYFPTFPKCVNADNARGQIVGRLFHEFVLGSRIELIRLVLHAA